MGRVGGYSKTELILGIGGRFCRASLHLKEWHVVVSGSSFYFGWLGACQSVQAVCMGRRCAAGDNGGLN